MKKSVLQISQAWKTLSEPFSPLLMCLLLVLLALPFLGMAMSTMRLVYYLVAAGAVVMIIVVLFRLDELAVVLTVAVHLYVDWFLGLHLVGILMALILLFVCYFGRSAHHPWVEPRPLWLWLSFLILTIYPAIYGGRLRLYDRATFYPSIILGAFLMFWLGAVIAQDGVHLRKFFSILAGLGALLAVHTIIQATTGIFLFGSQRVNDLLVEVGNYQLTNGNATRAVSFLIDPNWNGALLALMTFLPLGLFLASSSLTGKLLYFFETILMLLALLFTYSNGGWVGAIAGFFIFLLLSGGMRSSFLVIFFILIMTILLIIFFPTEVGVQLQHASNPEEVRLRVGIWQSAVRTIQAFPLMGVGLGYKAYVLGTQPFNLSIDALASQSHDSYLEWAVMAGIPTLLIFVALLLSALRSALRNWARANVHTRALIAAGIASGVSLSFSSITINGWTHPVLAEVAWLVLGASTSPLLAQNLSNKQRKGIEGSASKESLMLDQEIFS